MIAHLYMKITGLMFGGYEYAREIVDAYQLWRSSNLLYFYNKIEIDLFGIYVLDLVCIKLVCVIFRGVGR